MKDIIKIKIKIVKNVTYVFSGKRKKIIESNNIQAKEFFYGALDFDKSEYQLKIIEFSNSQNLFHKFLKIVDRVVSKLFSIPFSSSKLCRFENFKTLLKTDQLILINEGVAFSILPLLILIKPFKKIKVSVFVMGLYSKKLNYQKLNIVHNALIKFLVLYLDNVFFLGVGEFNKAKKFHRKSKKLFFFPFSVDTNFWHYNNEPNFENNSKILFVGNDGNRNANLLIEIAKMIPQYQFTFVSKIPELQDLELENVEVLNGSWGDESIDDIRLRKIYMEACLVIIPLKESSQPSGQSVALQAMSMGLPVLISDTEGFWDEMYLKDGKNIFLISPNTQDEWVNKIKYLINNKLSLKEVSFEAKKVVKNNFNLSVFHETLMRII